MYVNLVMIVIYWLYHGSYLFFRGSETYTTQQRSFNNNLLVWLTSTLKKLIFKNKHRLQMPKAIMSAAYGFLSLSTKVNRYKRCLFSCNEIELLHKINHSPSSLTSIVPSPSASTALKAASYSNISSNDRVTGCRGFVLLVIQVILRQSTVGDFIPLECVCRTVMIRKWGSSLHLNISTLNFSSEQYWRVYLDIDVSS